MLSNQPFIVGCIYIFYMVTIFILVVRKIPKLSQYYLWHWSISICAILIGSFICGYFTGVTAQSTADRSEHVVVKLSAESKYSIITPKNGQRIHLFAKKLDIEPIMPNKLYSRHRVAFSHDKKIDRLAEQLDTDQDYIIDLDESFKLY